MTKTAIIGGGPSGMMAAIGAATKGEKITLYDHNEKLGKKLYITGKGRCNLTNACDLEHFFQNIVTNPKFLYTAYNAFDNKALMELVENAGCPLKVERGERVFPVSDKSSDILKALQNTIKKNNIYVELHKKVNKIVIDEFKRKHVKGIIVEGEFIPYDRIILATGGVSYQSTGSDGSGLKMAEELGHSISPLRPSLIGLKILEDWTKDLQGLSLKNVGLKLMEKKKCLVKQQGEMLFTHFGISGPMVLTASAYVKKKPENYYISIDLKPALSQEKLEARIIRDFELFTNKQVVNGLVELLPTRLIPIVLSISNIEKTKIINQITRSERLKLVESIKNIKLKISDYEDMNRAVITSGGIRVAEINPKTMASKLVDGLYFAGEIIDIDALTGGFNIQIAASTGYLSGISGLKEQWDENCD